jgi:hypothetical protein
MKIRHIVTVFILLVLSACSGARPVLYPNAQLESVGKEEAERDIEACRQLAESAGADESRGSGKVGRVATGTAVGAGAGAASGALGAVISGASAGLGSMVGAASGAVWGLLTGLFYAVVGPSSQPNQTYTNFVNRCLQEKGYEVTGWQ